jgi:tetratricopeptide (TPR) repeat protein
VFVVITYAILRTIAVGHGSHYDYIAGGDPFLSWGSALRARVFEIGQVLRPDYLSPSYLGVPVMTGWADAAFWLALAATAGCGWIAWRCRHRAPAVTAGIGWWVLFLLPTSQLIPLNMLMGNRWLYAPFIGLAAMLACGVGAADRRWGVLGRRVAFAIGVVWMAHCAVQTHARAELWGDEEALWIDAERSWPEDRIPYSAQVALYRRRAQQLHFTDPAGAEAARAAATDTALRLVARAPVNIQAAMVASSLLNSDRREVARRILEHAYSQVETPAYQLELSLANARWHTGDRDGAVELFDRMVAADDHRVATVDRVREGEVFYALNAPAGADRGPARAMFWLQRARLEFGDGRLDESDRSVREARALWPECQLAIWARASTLRAAGRPDLAMAEIDASWPEAAIQPLFELRAELAELGGKPEIALQTRIAAIERWPFVSSLWLDLAKNHQRIGEFGVARACFARAQDVAR